MKQPPFALPLIIASLSLLFALVHAIDPCTQVSQWPNRMKVQGGWQESKDCLKQFPFDRKVAHKTLDTVIDTLKSFFVFKDIASKPPKSRLSIKGVDVVKELKARKKRHYKSDFEFQTDIQNIVDSLFDAHFNYIPTCYSWSWKQPLFLYAPVVDGKQKIKVFNVLLNVLPSVTADLVECEVLEIDDKPAFEAMVKFAKNHGGPYKDLSVRLNAALTTKNSYSNGNFGWTSEWQTRSKLPPNPSVKYKLKCPSGKKELSLPWITYAPGGNFNDSASYFSMWCASPPSLKAEAPNYASLDTVPVPPSITPTGFKVINFDQDTFFFGYFPKGGHIHHNTGVMHVATFEPGNMTESIVTFITGIMNFKKLGIEKVIIDVQNNGGGYICMAQALLHVLFNDKQNHTTPDLEYATDILVSPQSLILGKLGTLISYDSFDDDYYSVATGKLLTDDSWLENSIKHKRGGKTNKYSQRVRSDCNGFIKPIGEILKKNNVGPLPWTPKDYVILSNGNCGSSCALFANRMHEIKHVKTIAVGGIHHKPMTYQSFPGLQVLSYDTDILPLINSESYGDLYKKYPALFRHIVPLPEQVFFRFTFREAYFPDRDNTPLEYKFLPADTRLDYNNVTARHIDALWLKVARSL